MNEEVTQNLLKGITEILIDHDAPSEMYDWYNLKLVRPTNNKEARKGELNETITKNNGNGGRRVHVKWRCPSDFPERNITNIFPWSPGTAMSVSQIVADALGEELGIC